MEHICAAAVGSAAKGVPGGSLRGLHLRALGRSIANSQARDKPRA
jgi:hypothetical protein